MYINDVAPQTPQYLAYAAETSRNKIECKGVKITHGTVLFSGWYIFDFVHDAHFDLSGLGKLI